MATGAVLGGIGAGVNAIQGISSAQNSKREGERAANQAQQQQDMMNKVLFGTGTSSDGMLGMARQGLEQGVGGLTDIAAGGSAELQALANQLSGGFQAHQDGPGFNFSDVGTGQSYNFQPGSSLMDQTMQAFDSEAAGARASALDSMARQSSANMQGLDALLAGRGISRGSGVAGGALADLAGAQAAETAALERELGAMGTQAALQGAQFDVQRRLQEQQMGSQYNLGERQFLADTGLAQQGMQSQYNLQNRGMLADISRSNEQLRQGALTGAGQLVDAGISNQMQAGLGTANAYAGMLGPLLNVFLGNQDLAAKQIGAAGAGSANPIGNSLMEFGRMFPGVSGGSNRFISPSQRKGY